MENTISSGNGARDRQWGMSIAVGGRKFVEEMKEKLGAKTPCPVGMEYRTGVE